MDEEPAPIDNSTPYLALNMILLGGLFISALATGWWAVVRAPDLLARNDNLRLIIQERYVRRGTIFDRSNSVISVTVGETGDFSRRYIYPDLAPITGYSDLNYGQAGLESVLDGYLRGLEGNPASTIWLNHLLYGTTPPGLDVRLSIDLRLQTLADEMMSGKQGAVILLNAETGEILVMSSHPTFDPNKLDENAAELLADPRKPLINRAALGIYPAGSVMEPFAQTLYRKADLNRDQWLNVFNTFGFTNTPELRMATAAPTPNNLEEFHASPLQMALASAALSHQGTIPPPRVVMAVNTPKNGWLTLPTEGKLVEAIQPAAWNEAALSYIQSGDVFWSHIGIGQSEESVVSWFIGGTPPNWQAAPLAIVVLLEEGTPGEVRRIGQDLLLGAMSP